MNEHNETEAIRSDIDVTRRRMDETMDALGNRLKGRHLLDEVLGFFRRSDGDADGVRQKIARSSSAAVHSVVGAVKANPMPALLIGAGVAWLVYNSRRDRSDENDAAMEQDFDYSSGVRATRESRYDPDTHYDRPLEYPTAGMSKEEELFGGSTGGASDDKSGGIKDKLRDKASAAKEKLGELGNTARDKMSAMKERAGEIGSRAQERAREVYSQSRERVVATAEQHPLELGLGCLALGLIAGLAIPTPDRVKRMAGPTVDRLRNRTREAGSEMMEKGKRVVRAATTAAKDEAQAQGLTTTERAEVSGNRSGDPGNRQATDPLAAGAMAADTGNITSSTARGNQPASNPSTARPTM